MRLFSIVFLVAISFIVFNSKQYFTGDPQLQAFSDSRGPAVILLNSDIDLKGKTLELPDNLIIRAGKGVIKNGTLVGCNTIIEGTKCIFDNIRIKGEWIVPHISTSLFRNLDYDNSLQDVFALSSPSIHNKITIEKGDYRVLSPPDRYALLLNSNTDIILNGNIILVPNSHQQYQIVSVHNSHDVRISGKGAIIGDKDNHLGTKGEWGMGISIQGGRNIFISGISILNCWGDCIYIGSASENICVSSCTLSNGRRQGISITSANKVIISNCHISHINGTDPGYAIDVEPNEGNKVDDIRINNVIVNDCSGGFAFWGRVNYPSVGHVLVENCTISGRYTKIPISSSRVEYVSIDSCKIAVEGDIIVSSSNTGSFVMRNNQILTNSRNPIVIHNSKDFLSNNTISQLDSKNGR